jgi:hypothetical protein
VLEPAKTGGPGGGLSFDLTVTDADMPNTLAAGSIAYELLPSKQRKSTTLAGDVAKIQVNSDLVSVDALSAVLTSPSGSRTVVVKKGSYATFMRAKPL